MNEAVPNVIVGKCAEIGLKPELSLPILSQGKCFLVSLGQSSSLHSQIFPEILPDHTIFRAHRTFVFAENTFLFIRGIIFFLFYFSDASSSFCFVT